ncbi:uncharacterized protein PY17X_1146500 [Plasmodium yoelii]|uniref:Uncharacterized protein n=4 Tax=Plasmodium yoelii TaxID=5861 RepID=A0AAF0B1G6_PLAYO|nr:uncharacterized protein PY17X_1146500 [Plasmodium yoelii]EAA18658.1 Drosophila melanogaster CG15040 gene product [Plasmodium yoelii yoelii]WBY58902.1 hypothetical protein Py17XNL_001105853 [Plasmodium yoelii yoelii]CDU19152.1 conserved Plasmodium protein, unknown function [Plasmodium yoelii]VTZ79737.1 conserved Plasmodium protein, unknown function [Plasmodium yoelii]|eukprot:XP_727093.1 uncharacterized protein PY17X_1146500 [Plasmodium yoelii]
MKCSLFSCKSTNYYNSSCFPISDDEEFDLFFNKINKKKDLHYMFENAVNEIIYKTKKNCEINSDFEQVEKKSKNAYSDQYLDDIDIILKKGKKENMFAKKKIKNKNNDPLFIPKKDSSIFPSENAKNIIYSKNKSETNIEYNSEKKTNTSKDSIIENFKNVLCNDLNKYIKEILHAINNNDEHPSYISIISKDNKISEDNSPNANSKNLNNNILTNNNENAQQLSHNHDEIHPNIIMDSSLNNLYIGDSNSSKGNNVSADHPENVQIKTCQLFKQNLNTNQMFHNKNKNYASHGNISITTENVDCKKKYVKKMKNKNKHTYNNSNKGVEKKYIYYTRGGNLFKKKNPLFKNENVNPYFNKKNDAYQTIKYTYKHNRCYTNESTNLNSNTSNYGNMKKERILNSPHKTLTKTNPNNDFTFSHFQKNANNNILNKFLS